MKKYIRKLNRKEGWIAVMLLCLLCTLVFGIWLSSGAWFGDRDGADLSVTLATIEVDSNTNESLKKTVWVALKNQQILSDDVTFSIAPRSSEFYARIGVFVTTDNATSEVAKDVIKFQGFVPTQNEGYTWVRDGEWYYFCDTNGKPAMLSHKDAGHAFGFMGKESFVMPNNLRPQHYSSDDTVELEIRVETVQARNVDDTTPLTLAPFFTTQYPTGNYSVEFRNTDNSALKAAQVVKYAGDVVAPSVPTVTGKMFQSWNTLIDGTGADVAVEEFSHITQNLVLYPRYKSNEVTVTVVQTSNGEISPGTTTTTYGSDLTFNIKPNGGYEIESITAGGSAIAVKDKNEQKVVLENIVGDTTLTATYSLKSYLISVLSTGDGTTTPSENQSVKFGEDVLFSFQAGEGKYISSLKIDGIEKISGVTTTTYEHEFLGVSSDHSVDVVYETSIYTISTRVQAFSDGYAYGSILPTSTTCAHGKSVSFSVSAFEGAYISSVKVAGVEQLSGVELSKTNIKVAPTENTEVVVTFAPLWKLTQTNSKYYVTEYLGSAQNLVVPSVIYDPATGGNVSIYGVRSLGNNSITSLTLSNGIAYVGGNGTNNIFSATESEIVSVTLPKSVQIIDAYAFLGCGKITNFVVPSALQQIGAHAFDNCSGITAYDMPKTLLQIGIGAFDGNTSLTQLTFNSTVAPTIADGSIFAGTSSSLAVRVPTSGKASYVSNLSNRSFAEGTYMYPLTGSTPIAKYVNNVFRYIYYVDIINGTGGSSTPSSGRVEVYETQDFSVTFTPSAGNRIEAIYLDSQDTNLLTVAEGDSQTYRFDDGSIKGSHLIEAVYSKMYIRLDINGGTGNQPLVVYNEDRTKFKINSDIEPQKSGKEFYYYSTNKADNEQGQNGTRYDLGLWYDIPNVSASTTLYAIYLTPTTNYTTTQNYVVIPKSVTSISGTSSKNIFGSASDSTLKFITLPRQTTIIGSYALYSCTALTGISYSDGTTQIGDYAFAGDNSVAKFRFSPAITTVGQGAFKNCSALTEATNFDNTKVSVVPNAMFQNCSNLTNVDFPKTIIQIGNEAFSGCAKLPNLDFSSTETAIIGTNAFANCTNIASIKFSSKLSSIGNGAFKFCTNLRTIYDLDKTILSSIGANAFEGCSNLLSIKFPQTLSTIGQTAFGDCEELVSVLNFENTNVKTLESYTFSNCSSLANISFSRALTEIKDYAMYCCESLRSLTSLSSTKLTKIGKYAFAETYALSQMSLPTSYFTTIDANAFENSTIKKITNLKNCSKLKIIGENAFKNAGLTEIEFPACAFEIKSSAFANCAALTKVTFNNATAPTVAENSFEGTTSAVKVFIPNGKIDAYAPMGAGGLHNTGFASGTDSLLTSYTAVDYIESTGAQYINTGVYTKATTAIEIDFQYTEVSTRQQRTFGPTHDSDTGSNVSLGSYINGGGNWAYAYKDGTGNWVNSGIAATTDRTQILLDGKNKIFKITTNNVVKYNNALNGSVTRTSNESMSLFADATTTRNGATNYAKLKCYSAKIWDNGTLVRDYVPCVRNSDGVAGMFDKVQNKFYTNAGTGSFSTGEANSTVVEEYQRVEYIASSGTQYINTGYYWRSDNTRVILSANVTANGNYQSLFGNEEHMSSGGNSKRYFGVIPHGTNGSMSFYAFNTGYAAMTFALNKDMIMEVSTSLNGSTRSVSASITQNGTTKTNSANPSAGSVITNPNKLENGVGHIYLFANHNSGDGAVYNGATPNMNGTQIIGGMKVYSFKMYDNGVLVRDFVPVVRTSNNEVGLYDLVEGKFYGNAGSGTFSAGAVITPEKAVESGASMHYIGKNATIATCIEDTFKRHFDITMSDATYFVQENTTRTMEINETLPKGASVQYSWTSSDGRSGTGNTFSAIGVYTVTAKVFGTFYATTKTSAVLTISQASLSGITFMDKTFIYDGTQKSITITGKLPDGATVSYSIEGKNGASVDAGATNGTTEVGVYTVTANFGGILAGNTLTATLTITKATKTIALSNKTVTYNKSAHSLDIPTLPNGMTVASSSVSGNEYNDKHQCIVSVSASATGSEVITRTNAGVYTITVNFSGGRNYLDTTSSATLTINIASLASAKFPATTAYNGKGWTYDGTTHTIVPELNGEALTDVQIEYRYTGTLSGDDNKIRDAGTYSLTATIKGGQNYNDTSCSITFVVAQATLSTKLDAYSTLYTGNAQTYPFNNSVSGVGEDGSFTPSQCNISSTLSGTEYSASDTNSSTPSGGSISVSGLTATNAGKYTPKLVINAPLSKNGIQNYKTLTIEKANAFIIQKASMSFAVSSVRALSSTSFVNTLTLQAEVTNPPKITYSSSDTTKATVYSSGSVNVTSTLCDRTSTTAASQVTITATNQNLITTSFTINLVPFVYSSSNKSITDYTSTMGGADGVVYFPATLENINVISSGVIQGTTQNLSVVALTGRESGRWFINFYPVIGQSYEYTRVVVKEGITSLGTAALAYAKIKQLELPASLTYIGEDALRGAECESIIFKSTTISYYDSDSIAYLDAIKEICLVNNFSTPYSISRLNSYAWRFSSTKISNQDWSKTTSTPTELSTKGYYYVVAEGEVYVETTGVGATWFSSLASACKDSDYVVGKTSTITVYADQVLTSEITIASGTDMKIVGPVYSVVIKRGKASTSSETVEMLHVTGGTLNLGATAQDNIVIDGGSLSDNISSMIFVQSGTLTMSGGTIQNCIAYGGRGGAVYVDTGKFVMSGGTIKDCLGACGAISNTSGKLYINGTIKNCDGILAGGAILNSGYCEFSGEILSCNSILGGAIGSTGELVVKDGAIISDCHVKNDDNVSINGVYVEPRGGGIYVLGDGSLTMNGGQILNCTSDLDGGGVCVFEGTFNMSGGTIDGCQANDNAGGGVYLIDGAFNFSSGTISNCVANHGGGVGVKYDYSADLTFAMSGGTISSCTANYNGGGVYNGSLTTITEGSIEKCKAGSGGAIFNQSILQIAGGSISGCSATSGGGIYEDGSTSMFFGTMLSCQATNGGGIYLQSGTLDIGSDTKFAFVGNPFFTEQENTATNGGGVYVAGGTLNMYSRGYVAHNIATNGGGIYATGSSNVSIYGVIANNIAKSNGGGLYAKECSIYVDGGSISYNEAQGNDGFGGGIYAYKTRNLILRNNAMVDHNVINRGYGGGIYLNQNGSMNFSSVTKCNFKILNSSVSYNKARQGGGLYLINAIRSEYRTNAVESVVDNWIEKDNQNYCEFDSATMSQNEINNGTTNSSSSLMYVDYVSYIILNGQTVMDGDICLGSHQEYNKNTMSGYRFPLFQIKYGQPSKWGNSDPLHFSADYAGEYFIGNLHSRCDFECSAGTIQEGTDVGHSVFYIK